MASIGLEEWKVIAGISAIRLTIHIIVEVRGFLKSDFFALKNFFVYIL